MSKIAKSMAVLGVVAGLGVAALPLSSYAAPAESTPVTIRAKVDSSLAVSSDAANNLVDLGTVNTTSGVSSQTTTVTVTGTEDYYNLGVMDQDADNNMNWVNAGGTTQVGGSAVKLIPTVGADSNGDLTGGWGFRVNNGVNAAAGAWTEMPVYVAAGVDNLVKNGALDKTNGSATDVEFGVNIDGLALENGIYEDVVVFVATPGTNTGA